MYEVFFGSDRKSARDSATEYISKNMPEGATLTTVEGGGYEEGIINDALGASSLFGGEEWFVIDTPSDNKDCLEEVKGLLEQMSESNNTFIILEGALLAPAKKTYGKYAKDTHEFKAETVERFNSFGLAEALAGKDKRKLWVLLQEAKLAGLREEEVVGMLWWQLKALRLASVTKTASEAGMKDFPYNKAKRALSKFTEGEVEKLSQSLLGLYHDGHGGIRDMDIALEQWALKM
jgi:DNA polymerase III delta subunit